LLRRFLIAGFKLLVQQILNRHSYTEGGFYVIGVNDGIVDLEPFVKESDMAIGLATVENGVLKVDQNYSGPIDWCGRRGRWFLGLYSNDSDEVGKRKTASSRKT